MFIGNDEAFKRDRIVKGNAFKNFYFGLPLFGLITFLMYESHSPTRDRSFFFFCVVVPFEVAFYLFFMWSTARMAKRWNNTIKTISFENGEMVAETFDVLWLRSKAYSIPTKEVIFKQSVFEWYAKNGRSEGYTIKADTSSDLYFVKDYFDEYDEVVSLFKK